MHFASARATIQLGVRAMVKSVTSIASHVSGLVSGDALDAARLAESAQGLLPRLASALQVTLELDVLIEVFAREVRALLPCDGIEYVNQDHELRLSSGEGGRHRCQYAIRLNAESLGEVAFTRRKRFSEAEMMLLEHFVAGLVYPLRNALQYRQVLRSSYLDPLTGLQNRTAFESALSNEVDRAHRHAVPFSILVLDIDHFKQINDRHGHLAGDAALAQFARLLAKRVRRSDLSFRFGGEEFVVFLPNTGLTGATRLAERIRAATRALHCAWDGQAIPLAVSIGAAELRLGEGGPELFVRADEALYQAKLGGRDRVGTAA